MHEQVIILVAANAGRLDFVPVKQVRNYKEKLLNYFNTEQGEICEELEKSGELSDQLKKRILDSVDAFNDVENKQLKEEIEIAHGNN